MRRRFILMKNKATLHRPKYQLFNMKWEFHLNDDDHFPSVPHGHNITGKEKLKLSIPDCMIYKSGKAWRSLHKKDINRLLNDEGFILFREKAIAIYNEKFHYRPKVLMKRRMSINIQPKVAFTFESENPIHEIFGQRTLRRKPKRTLGTFKS